ncbi:MAG: GIY-YIG nuclease family protein [Anaeromyxobacter sp.]|nr:GIY-YIG nuclease family protein [Anaeromyxobacter sp.]MBL0278555.1 GIY-YIG nuclease family protein [Anaeromyxobacter sp.]
MAQPRAGWRVYLLRCRDGSLYTGATNDLDRRVARHAAGEGARYTRSRLPVVLVHQEQVGDRSAALRREAAIKRLPRAAKLALVAASPGKARRPRASAG